MKTWKKIEETKKRSKEVMELKRRNEERISKKVEHIRMQKAM